MRNDAFLLYVNVCVCVLENNQRELIEIAIPMKSDLLNLFRSALAAVDPCRCVKEHLRLTPVDSLKSSNEKSVQIQIDDQNLTLHQNLYVAAFGKAALGSVKMFVERILPLILLNLSLGMCRAVNEICPEHIVKGIASVPVGAIEQAKRKDDRLFHC